MCEFFLALLLIMYSSAKIGFFALFEKIIAKRFGAFVK